MIEYIKETMSLMCEMVEDIIVNVTLIGEMFLKTILWIFLFVTIPVWIIPFFVWRRKRGGNT